MGVISPCTSVCRMNPRTELCEGCGRTLTEIAEWLLYSDDEKRALLGELATRDAFGDGRDPLSGA